MSITAVNEQSVIAGIPHVDQFFGPWAIYEPSLEALRAKVEVLNIRQHMNSPKAIAIREQESQQPGMLITSDGIAVIQIEGSMQKHESSMGGTSTIAIRRQVRAANRNADIKAIMLKIDSPGGTVAGNKELGDDVAAAAKNKPVMAYIEDMGASAAYWIASQASKVVCNQTAIVGSIGTLSVIYDYSKAAESEGIKVHVIRAGELKGMGTPGTEVTEEQLAELQKLVNGLNEHFLQAVSSGRAMDKDRVKELADGRVHVGMAAKNLNLVDDVLAFDEAMASLLSMVPVRKRKPMSEASTERIAATLQELKSGCPDASSDFIIAQMDRNATLADAQVAWMREQSKANETLQEQLKAQVEKTEKAEAKLAEVEAKLAAKPQAGGVDPVGSGASAESEDFDGDAVATWKAKIAEKTKAGMTKQKAVIAVNRENPGLRAAFLAASQG